MVPTPLHALAEAARSQLPRRAERAEQILAEEVTASLAGAARISVNMKPKALERFLDGEPRRNDFEWAEEQARRTGKTVEDLLRGRLRDWYAARVDFEQKAGGGRYFHYAALNAGGMGTPRYGRLCVVDRHPIGTSRPDPVWVAEDSLTGTRFRTVDRELDWEKLGRWVAPCDMAAELVILKLDDEGPSDRPLPERICREDCYVEALSLGPIKRKAVEEIRSESDDALQERALAAVLDGAPSGEEFDLALHERIRAKAQTLGIRWRQVQT